MNNQVEVSELDSAPSVGVANTLESLSFNASFANFDSTQEAALAQIISGIPEIVYEFAKDAVIALTENEHFSPAEIARLQQWQFSSGSEELMYDSSESAPLSKESAIALTTYRGAVVAHLDYNPWKKEEELLFFKEAELEQDQARQFRSTNFSQLLLDRYGEDKDLKRDLLAESYSPPSKFAEIKKESKWRQPERQVPEPKPSMIESPTVTPKILPIASGRASKQEDSSFTQFWNQSEALRPTLRELRDICDQQEVTLSEDMIGRAGDAIVAAKNLRSVLSAQQGSHADKAKAGVLLNLEIISLNITRMSEHVFNDASTSAPGHQALNQQFRDFCVSLDQFFEQLEEFTSFNNSKEIIGASD